MILYTNFKPSKSTKKKILTYWYIFQLIFDYCYNNITCNQIYKINQYLLKQCLKNTTFIFLLTTSF